MAEHRCLTHFCDTKIDTTCWKCEYDRLRRVCSDVVGSMVSVDDKFAVSTEALRRLKNALDAG